MNVKFSISQQNETNCWKGLRGTNMEIARREVGNEESKGVIIVDLTTFI